MPRFKSHEKMGFIERLPLLEKTYNNNELSFCEPIAADSSKL